MNCLLAASCARSIPVAFWQSGGYWAAEWGWYYFSSSALLPAEKDQVALTACTQLVVCSCVVPATVRCKGVEIIAGESGIQPPFFSGEHRCMALQNVRQHILLLVLAFPVVSQTLTRLSVNHWRNRCLH